MTERPTGPPDDPRTEHRLRAAMRARADSVDPSADSLQRIEEQTMSTSRFTTRHWATIGALAAAAVIAIVALVAVSDDDGDEEVVANSTTSTTDTTAPTTETTPTTGFTTTFDEAEAVFPAATASRRFDDPAAAARAFAVDYIGFIDPVLSEFHAGDPSSGEVEIRPDATGPVTVILVRLLSDETWGVTGAITGDITPEEPAVGDRVSSPVTLTGTALAFEGTVDVEIREHGVREPIGTGFVTGSGTPPAGPYESSIEFSAPTATTGAILYREFSARDGSVRQAAVTPIVFAP